MPVNGRAAPTGLDVALAVASKAGAPAHGAAGGSVPPVKAASAFLTPRVVDQRVFEDFAGQLRHVAAEADARASALADLVAKSDRAVASASESARQHRAAVEVLGKLLHALNARAAEVGDLIGKCDARLADLREAERRLESTAERVIDRFEARFAARLEHIAGGPAASAVGALVDDAERVKDELGATLRRIRDEQARASEAAEHLARTVDRSRSESSALVERADRAGASLSAQLRAADEVGARAFQRINEATDAAAPLESLLGSCARADASLRERLRLGEALKEESSGIAAQLSALLNRADATREEMRSWASLLEIKADGSGAASGTHAGGRLPEPLERIVREFRTSLAQDLSKMAGAMSLIARRAETSVRTVEGGGAEIVIRAGGGAGHARAD